MAEGIIRERAMTYVETPSSNCVKACVLLLAAQQSIIELSEADKAFIGMVLDGHALKA